MADTLLIQSALDRVKAFFASDHDRPVSHESGLDDLLIQITYDYLHEMQQPVPPDLGVPQTLAILSQIFEQPYEAASFIALIESLIKQTVRVHQPAFIGHMTSALPHYVPSLMYLTGALNQNQVKLETSGGFSAVEKYVLVELHQLFFQKTKAFYDGYLNNPDISLGAFCSGGTLGNLTAFWAFRKAYEAVYPDKRVNIRVYMSELGHYSIRKAADIIGLTTEQIVVLPNAFFKNSTDRLRQKILEDQISGFRAMVIVGVAGATETGAVDHLQALADIAQEFKCFFHVDAAWGGAFYCVDSLKPVFEGIERADAIVVDAHKQLYVPIGCGVVLFREENLARKLEYHAHYIIRKGSFDLGQFTLEGSRPAMSLVLFSHLRLIGMSGFNILFAALHQLAQDFAAVIDQSEDFQLITKPELNILTYRYCPQHLRIRCTSSSKAASLVNEATQRLHKLHRATGTGFVSRTRLAVQGYAEMMDVFRVVLANPNTELQHCLNILDEQRLIVKQDETITALLKEASSLYL